MPDGKGHIGLHLHESMTYLAPLFALGLDSEGNMELGSKNVYGKK
jgi:hypothetical protein